MAINCLIGSQFQVSELCKNNIVWLQERKDAHLIKTEKKAFTFSLLNVIIPVLFWKGGLLMRYCTCKNCGANLEIRENDTMPGCRDMEVVFCPVCNEEATKVFTSGFPTAYVVEE
ncbi:MAG: hypothetical protein IJZ39_11435 [Oscillospiraceae bacterium]|nr:hypothetical protein [Oscillospiraceae bacterium]